MFVNGQRIYSIASNRAGTFLSYSNTRKSAWVRLDGDISITDQSLWCINAADADGNSLQRLVTIAARNGVPYDKAYELAVVSAAVNL